MKRDTPKNTTELIKWLRGIEQYEAWKRAVFIRDRFTCQLCGARNGRRRVIEADHIISFSTLVKENNITSVAEAIECPALWQISNGRTLCHSCHEKTDSYIPRFIGTNNKKVKK